MVVRALSYIVLGGLLAIGGVVAFTGAGPVDVQVDVNDSLVGGSDTTASGDREDSDVSSGGSDESQSTTPAPTESSPFTDSLDTERIEWELHARINEIRQERGLSRLKMDGKLQGIARNHSADMAERGYFSHESPEGNRVEDRYESVGYSCRIPVSGNRYATGGENIAQTWAYGDIQSNGGIVSYDGNETEIAHGIARQWMNSAGHRENILESYWQYEGIGIATTEEDGDLKVYATQNFC